MLIVLLFLLIIADSFFTSSIRLHLSDEDILDELIEECMMCDSEKIK